MDIRINLLPQELKTKRAEKRKQRQIFIGVVMTLVLMFFFYTALLGATAAANSEVEFLRQKHLTLEEQLAQFRQYEERLEQVKSFDEVVTKAVGTPTKWSELLLQIGLQSPLDISLENISIRGNELTLRGVALDHQGVAQWLEILQEIPGIEKAQVQFSNQSTGAMTQFEFRAQIDREAIDNKKDIQ
ncbi:PilN domain-containing protein [Heliorestis convoluta]|uniref:Fimbrial assembly family protein n=1 Tax=Heliorestis convoluta TaxID=356322 RepID=A0A5Q2MW84_9FIRM|nr:PilN domain-containing protein [Heliorestis convoluta]QGG46588.1 fimbrial assembly family protein [Heliorestis convoluta]